MDDRRRVVLAAAMALGLPLGGCEGLRQPYVALPVGTCVRVSDEAEVVVPCADPHTHIVVAIVRDAEACPPETNVFSEPADPHDGPVTTCYAPDAAPDQSSPR